MSFKLQDGKLVKHPRRESPAKDQSCPWHRTLLDNGWWYISNALHESEVIEEIYQNRELQP